MNSEFKIKNYYYFIVLSTMLLAYACSTTKKTSTVNNKSFYKDYSEKLGIPLSGNENKLLITTISDWLGVPYKYGDCSKQGIDCSCFVQIIFRDVYKKDISRQTIDIFNKDIEIIDKSKLKEGDLVFFKIASQKPDHVGIYLSDGHFVHASSKKGIMISSLNEDYFKKYFFNAGRVKQ